MFPHSQKKAEEAHKIFEGLGPKVELVSVGSLRDTVGVGRELSVKLLNFRFTGVISCLVTFTLICILLPLAAAL